MCKTKKAREYLMQLKENDGDIENLLAEAERWRLIATGTASRTDSERVQSSGSHQRMADAVCKYVDIEEDIKRHLGALAEKRKEILETIRKLPYDKRNVIHKRYVQDMSFDEIASVCDKSRSWVTSIHGRALQDVQSILDERERACNTPN